MTALFERLCFASVEFALLALLAAAALRLLRPAPRTAALCWAAVLCKPLVSLLIGSPLALVEVPGFDPRAASPPRAAAVEFPTHRRDAPPGSSASGTPVLAPTVVPAATSGSRATEHGAVDAEIRAADASDGDDPWNVSRVAIACWSAGIAVMCLRSLRDRVSLRRLLAGSQPLPPPLRRLLARIAAPLRLRSMPAVLVTSGLASPALVGVISPTVLLPAWMVEPDAAHHSWMLRWSLRHELAHFRQRDGWLLLLREVAQTVFFFHPLLWWVSRQLDLTLELACDRAIVRGPRQAHAYACQLLAIRERAPRERPVAIAGAFVVRTRLLERVQQLIRESPTTGRPRGRAVARGLPLIVLLATLVGARAQRPTSASARPADPVTEGARTLRGRVVDSAAQPVANATIRVVRRRSSADGTDGTEGRGEELATTTTGAGGAFAVAVPTRLASDDAVGVIATASGFVPAWRTSRWQVAEALDDLDDATLVLSKDDVPVEARITDLEGKPVADAEIRVASVESLGRASFDELMRCLASNAGAQEERAESGLMSELVASVPGIPTGARTDSEGRFRLVGCGRDRRLSLEIRARGFGFTNLVVYTHPGADFDALRRAGGQEGLAPFAVMPRVSRYGPSFTHAIEPEQRITGVVVDEKSGEPIPDCEVKDFMLSRECRCRTDAAGRFELAGLPRRTDYRLQVRPPPGRACFAAEIDVAANASLTRVETRVALRRGIRVHGRITDGSSGAPIRGTVGYWAYVDNSYASGIGPALNETVCTDDDGRYEATVLPGPGFVGVLRSRDREFCTARQEDFHREPGGLGYVLTGGAMISSWMLNEVRFVDPPVGTKELTVDMALRRGRKLTLRVTGLDGKPVQGCRIFGRAPDWFGDERVEGPEVAVVGLEPAMKRRVLLVDEVSGGALAIHLTGDESGVRDVRLEPCAFMTGRFVDEDGHPLPGRAYSHSATSDSKSAFASGIRSTAQAGADGRFRTALVPGVAYVSALPDRVEFELAAGEVKDFGDIRVPDRAGRMR